MTNYIYYPKILDDFQLSIAKMSYNIYDANFYEYICDVELAYKREINNIEKNWKRKNRITLYQAAQIFKEDLFTICYDKIYDPETPQEEKEHFEYILRLIKSNKPKIQVEDVKHVEMEQILDHFHIEHRRNRTSCPICDGSNSTQFSFKNNVFNCFKCGVKGDSIEFLKQYQGMEFKQSLEYLKENF